MQVQSSPDHHKGLDTDLQTLGSEAHTGTQNPAQVQEQHKAGVESQPAVWVVTLPVVTGQARGTEVLEQHVLPG